MPYIVRNGIVYSAGGGGSGEEVTKQTVADWGFYELPEGGIPAEDIAEGVIPTIPESLPASDVPSWAKQPTKPSYTASEVGALSADGKAADSDKLDGHDSDHFATATAVTALGEDVNRHAFGEQSGSRNIWNEVWTNRNIQGTVGQKFTPLIGNYVGNSSAIELKPSTKYVFCKTATAYVYFYDASLNLIQAYTTLSSGGNQEFTTPSNTKYMYFLMAVPYGTVYKHDLAIIEGASGTYEPYIASNAQLMEAVEESEVRDAELRVLGWNVPSGMSLKNTVENGVFTQKVGRVDLGNLNWEYSQAGYFLANNLSPKSNTIWGIYGYPNVYSASYQSDAAWNDIVSTLKDKRISSYDNQVRISDSSYTDVSSLVNHVKGNYFYYELATPITHNLTDMPTQKSMISDEWDSTKTYVVGELCIYNNALYECLVQNSGQNPFTATSYWKKTSVSNLKIKSETVHVVTNGYGIANIPANRNYIGVIGSGYVVVSINKIDISEYIVSVFHLPTGAPWTGEADVTLLYI